LVPELSAIRLRSDVLRKHRYSLASDDASQSSLREGLYGIQATKSVYEQPAVLAAGLLRCGENVIVDCTNLRSWQRKLFYEAAQTAASHCIVLYLTAPSAVLESRILQRQAQGKDVSEADLAVLEWQLEQVEVPTEPEPVLHISTECASLQKILSSLKAFYS